MRGWSWFLTIWGELVALLRLVLEHKVGHRLCSLLGGHQAIVEVADGAGRLACPSRAVQCRGQESFGTSGDTGDSIHMIKQAQLTCSCCSCCPQRRKKLTLRSHRPVALSRALFACHFLQSSQRFLHKCRTGQSGHASICDRQRLCPRVVWGVMRSIRRQPTQKFEIFTASPWNMKKLEPLPGR